MRASGQEGLWTYETLLSSRPDGRETSKINHDRIEAPHLHEDAMTSLVDRLLATCEGRVRVAVTIVRPQTGTTPMAASDSQLQSGCAPDDAEAEIKFAVAMPAGQG